MSIAFQFKQSTHEARVPVTLLKLKGELDSKSFETFQNEVMQMIDSGASYMVLDLQQLSFISSAGLRALFTIAKTLLAKGGVDPTTDQNAVSFKSPYLKLLAPTSNIRQALDLMGFTVSLEIYNDLSEALASF